MLTVRGFGEGEQAIEELLLHFDPDYGAELYPVYRDLARALSPETRILVVVPDARHLEGARFTLQSAGFAEARCEFCATERPISVWARDRMIPLVTGGRLEFFRPLGDQVDAERAGDLDVAPLLAQRRSGTLLGGMFLEGGNVIVGSGRVFVGRTVVEENPGVGGAVAVVERRLRELFGAEPLVLGTASTLPHPHIDMMLTHIGDRTVLLADPVPGIELLRALRRMRMPSFIGVPMVEVTEELQIRKLPGYEVMLGQLRRTGLQIDRLPILHSTGDGVYTWNNAIVERRADGRRAYVPVYGVPQLDEMALATYRRHGLRAFPIDVSRVMHMGGAVRCLSNVVRWGDPHVARPVQPRPVRG
ncbi:MAG: agmatine deiminase family protein [Planctomycetes bacterium]|nr:agmatine deiminase family protein [Planctomycetota bacterium]